jgi:hypothetical protein
VVVQKRPGEHWGRVEGIEAEDDRRMLREERERYERILKPLINEAAFRRGYEAGRAAETTSAALKSPLAVSAS